ncbi:MAG: hypothetical protein C0497_13360 [Gemmatimonas sp.]|nr:hypothetical protein [Gemmatimonas sp.]
MPYLRPPSPDGPTRDREALVIVPADTSLPPVTVGEFAGYGLVYLTPPGAAEPHFLMDALNAGTSWLVVGNEVAVGDPASPEVLMFTAAGTRARKIVLPVKPRPFNVKALREARDRMAPVVLGGRRVRSPSRAASDTTHFELMFDLAKRPKTAPHFRRLVHATNDGMWVELYREHIGLPSAYLRIDTEGRISGRLSGPANVEFHEFGTDYALGVREDPETDVKSVVLYTLRRSRSR